jgi:transcriptional regulator with XRE-family HTH domain
MKFQDKLQILRKQKGISQEKLAEKIGVSRQAVAKWEVGQSYPDMDNLILLSELFRTSIDRLVKDYEDENCTYDSAPTSPLIDDTMIDFLIRAKKSTYAAKGAEVNPSRPNSHDLQFVENKFKYIDTYLGGEKFAGEEAVWFEDKPFWSMNYVGRVLAEGFSGDFLKECLLLVPKEYPFRGPLVHRNGDFTYHCVINGEFEWFSGYEEIFAGGTRVFECVFHGGAIK